MTPAKVLRKKTTRNAAEVVAWLKRKGSKKARDGMARYGLPSDKAFGVGIGVMQRYAKEIGRSHDLALALWETGWYEARTVAAFVDEPDRVTPAQMDRWCRDFDSWGICDTVCFHLFDRTALAWSKVNAWARARPEFKKRAAFALLWGLTVHDKQAPDKDFLACLPLIERAAVDERDYVKKGVDMAFRALGKRNATLRESAVTFARQLSLSEQGAQAWVGRSALRELVKNRRAK